MYHTADPIPMGTCNGFGTSCSLVGVALESRCHLGRTVRYDTISTLGWSSNVVNHGIAALIDGVLSRNDTDWAGSGVNGSVPVAAPEDDCVVSAFCFFDLGWALGLDRELIGPWVGLL